MARLGNQWNGVFNMSGASLLEGQARTRNSANHRSGARCILMIPPRLSVWWHTALLESQWAVQSRLRSNDGSDVMDYVACEAGMDLGRMSGAGGGSGNEWEECVCFARAAHVWIDS